MPRVAILPSVVADQIAAGEVVERPASAVKELVENALDAGASAIEVEVEEGGRTLIRVSDDGCGMDRADAELALARHATSKIRDAADLVGVKSFGFRGEALPAIASVSRVELLSATRDGAATLVRTEGGAATSTEEASRRRGTTVTVRQLFYNTPARRKFLRSARSEWRAIADSLIATGLTRRDVHFRVTSDGREALVLTPAPTLRSRVADVWGLDYGARFIDVDGVLGPIRVCGLVERPGDVGTSSRRAIVIVNGRVVRDLGIARAVEAAYRSTLPAGLRPSLVVDLTVPADAVDVNVHPAKVEIRLQDRWSVERAVTQIVQRSLGTVESAPWLGRWADSASGLPLSPTSWEGGNGDVLPGAGLAPSQVSLGVQVRTGAPTVETDGSVAVAPDGDVPVAAPALVQLHRTYLMYEHSDGLVLIDQHSAHERVLYERFLTAFERGAPSQRLLFPETVHLSPAEGEAYEAAAEFFARVGYDIEAFGGHTLLLQAVPTPHPRFDAIRCLRESLASLSGDRNAATHAQHERLAATLACKAAVKAGDALAPDEMAALYVALSRTTLAAHDVHGRATIVRLSWAEVERRFGRR
jgi:DNA mismatch repair protein MutL